MIGHLEGDVQKVGDGWLIVSVGGVGYKVAVTGNTLAHAKNGTRAALWTHMVVREDALELYGFETEEELRFFELLIPISGIGPKSALAILDIASVETLRSAIAEGNTGYLTNVSGIGRKRAEKIVLELRDKVGLTEAESGKVLRGDEEALEAMKALGYSREEARDALRKVPRTVTSGSERLREALKALGVRE